MEQNNKNWYGMRDPDKGPNPWILNIEQAAKQNPNYRTTLWTGEHLQLTVMSIPIGGEIGLEVHPDTDQFIRVESGSAKAVMGPAEDDLTFQQFVVDGDAIFVPAGTWHNVINYGAWPLKLYTIYAPPHHPHGTVHRTKEEADADEHDHE